MADKVWKNSISCLRKKGPLKHVGLTSSKQVGYLRLSPCHCALITVDNFGIGQESAAQFPRRQNHITEAATEEES